MSEPLTCEYCGGVLTYANARVAALEAERDRLREALEACTTVLMEPGIQDVDEWNRDFRLATHKAFAALAAAPQEEKPSVSGENDEHREMRP